MTPERNSTIHILNNHMKGTLYVASQSDPDDPVMRGYITIDRSVLKVAVFPKKTSKSGNEYFPVRLRYAEPTEFQLQSVHAD